MIKACKFWFDQQRDTDNRSKRLEKPEIAKKFDVSLSSFEKFTHSDPSERRKLGHMIAGRPSIISETNLKQILSFAEGTEFVDEKQYASVL